MAPDPRGLPKVSACEGGDGLRAQDRAAGRSGRIPAPSRSTAEHADRRRRAGSEIGSPITTDEDRFERGLQRLLDGLEAWVEGARA